MRADKKVELFPDESGSEHFSQPTFAGPGLNDRRGQSKIIGAWNQGNVSNIALIRRLKSYGTELPISAFA